MQKNVKFRFIYSKFSRFMFFCILLFSVAGFVFAKSDFIISPVEGQWANYQSIIIDVPEGATAFYSFTGDNPLYSGFAYESPVLLELEGDINLKVAILNKDDTVIEESVNFSVNKVPLEVPFYSESQTNAVVLVKEKNLSIPSFMRYSLDDFQEPYLKGRTLTVDSKNSLEQILPLIIQNGRSLYRFMLHVLPNVSNENNQYNLTNTFSNDSSFEDDYTVRRIEKKLSQVPFILEFDDWSKIKISTSENIYVCLDDDVWQTGNIVLDCNRDVEHSLSWIDLTGANLDEFIPEQFKVFYTKIPTKPNLIVEQDKTKIAKISLSDKNYLMSLLQNKFSVGRNSENLIKDSVFVVDTLWGNDLETSVCVEVFYDGIYQGKFSEKISVDKKPPVSPGILLSDDNFFVRNPVEIKFNSDEKIFYVLKSKEISTLDLRNLEVDVNKNFAVDLSAAVELKEDSLVLFEDSENAIFFNLAYFSKDDFGNISEIEYYQVLIDSYNYYVEAISNKVNYVQDGSAARPFTSISQILPFLNKNKFIKLHIEGDFENIVSLTFTSPCEIISKNGARLSFAKDSFINVENTELKISNCVLEQNFVDSNSFSQQNLFKLNNANLIIDNCETVSLYKNNGSVIFANNSDVQVLNSGVTVQSGIFASIFNLLNSNLTCNQTRLSVVSKSAISLSMNLGKLNLVDSQIQVDGSTTKFYELFGVEYSIDNNKFLYKNYSKDMQSCDVFSKKISCERNEINSF